MTKDSDSNKPASREREQRKKMRRLSKERRDQVRWDMDNPMRRKSPGRRALDRLMQALDFVRK
ncbi:MAG: hypothetical protein NUV55_01590 [Sulfuricaulis sp.]|uniref:hypothetical protein n=1 Tax=Sulfuricaulis sp. TaxID=2003553 RepID=UPI0025E029F1|nr:hypothetical protein [Sulfuricaulis sp.]MCR4345888.1 hypothetical protein [Sulfuricaulis sp.]